MPTASWLKGRQALNLATWKCQTACTGNAGCNTGQIEGGNWDYGVKLYWLQGNVSWWNIMRLCRQYEQNTLLQYSLHCSSDSKYVYCVGKIYLFNFAAGEIMQPAVQSPLCVSTGVFNHSHWQWHSCLLPGYSDDGEAVLRHTGHLTECCSTRAASACQSSGALRGYAQSMVQNVGDLDSVGQLAEGRNWGRVHYR